jgi:hypothetical protein
VAPSAGPGSTGPSAPRSTAESGAVSHRHHHPHQKASPGPSTASHSADATQASGELDPAASTTGDNGSGLPGWVAPVVVLALFAAAATLLVRRRRRSGGA